MRIKLLTVVSIVTVALTLSGCSLLDPGPHRGSDGRFAESTVISASELVDGDCFSFNSADGKVVEQVTVVPCAQTHAYIIIGQGTLTPSDVTSAGSLQNAVSGACKPAFDAFKAAIKGATRPKQEFMVFAESEQPDADTRYSCMSTDPDQNFVTPTPDSEQTPAPAPEQTTAP